MFSLFTLLIIGCLIGAYFQRGLNRALLIILAIAILELKSLAVGVKIFSLTVIAGVLVAYLLKIRKRK